MPKLADGRNSRDRASLVKHERGGGQDSPRAIACADGDSLSSRTISGFWWLLLQTIGTRVVQFVGQIVLAWLLLPKDFGLIGLALTVTTVIGCLGNLWVVQVFVNRQKDFHRWATAAFWMSGSAGLATSVLTAASAPVAAIVYHSPALEALILILSPTAFLQALAVVPGARLESLLQFRLQACFAFVRAFLTMSLTILLATFGFGAKSFAWPPLLIGVVMLALYWWAAPVRLRLHLQLRRWRFLLRDSLFAWGASSIYKISLQIDYVMLGAMYAAKIVGVYFFGYTLANQAMALFANNLGRVLFPSLTRLQGDPSRQTDACIRATRVMAMLMVPIALSQAALAGPLIRLIFEPKWWNSIPIIQVLSIGMVGRVVGASTGNLMLAQGRFGEKMLQEFSYLSLLSVCVGIGAWYGAAFGAAIGVVSAMVTGEPVLIYLRLRPGGGRWRDVIDICAAPIAASVLAIGLPTLAWIYEPKHPVFDIARLITIPIAAVCLYLPLIRFTSPSAFNEAMARVAESSIISKLVTRFKRFAWS